MEERRKKRAGKMDDEDSVEKYSQRKEGKHVKRTNEVNRKEIEQGTRL